jgi:protein TonB
MLRDQRFAIALTVSLAAHAGAGLGSWTTWHMGGQQGSASSRALTAILLEDASTVEAPSAAPPVAELPESPDKVVEAATAKVSRSPFPGQTELSAFTEATATAPPTGNASRPPATERRTRLTTGHNEKAMPPATTSQLATSLPEPSDDEPLDPTPVTSAATSSQVPDAMPGNAPARHEVERYWTELAARIERQKRYPRVARERRQEGVVQLSFVLDRQGRVVSKQITRSAGYPTLDREAMRMLERAAPLPAAPERIADSNLRISIPIEFRLP